MQTYGDKLTPILLAVQNGQLETYMYMAVELKCNSQAVDHRRNNALHIAIMA